MDDRICPVCQQKNAWAAPHCAHCGFAFQNPPSLDRSTLGMHSAPDSAPATPTDCTDYLKDLSTRAILFLIHKEQERVVFENTSQIIIGRYNDTRDQAFFDMARFGEVSMGISRRHAKISQQRGQYFIKDLGSTNGTWINRQRLTPYEPFPLACGDVLSIGPVLQMLVCFHALADEVVTRFVLKPIATAPTPDATFGFLATHIMAYLETVETIQELLNLYQGQPHQPASLRNLSIREGTYEVELSGGAAALQLLENELNPWLATRAHRGDADDPHLLRPALTSLAADWLENTASAVPDDRFPYIEKLAAALAAVVAIPVQLTISDAAWPI